MKREVIGRTGEKNFERIGARVWYILSKESHCTQTKRYGHFFSSSCDFGGGLAGDFAARHRERGQSHVSGLAGGIDRAKIAVHDLRSEAGAHVGEPGACVPVADGVERCGSERGRGDGDLYVIDALINTVVGFNANIPLAAGVAINPTGTKVYVAEGNDMGGVIDQIDMTTFQIVSRIQVGNLPHALLISPSGRQMAVTNALSNTISLISLNTNQVIRTIKLKGNHPLGLAWVRNIP